MIIADGTIVGLLLNGVKINVYSNGVFSFAKLIKLRDFIWDQLYFKMSCMYCC